MAKSFYDLDYIIDINEKRLEEYTASYQKVLDNITNIILVYSAIAIFLIPFVQHIIDHDIPGWMYYVSFILFLVFLLLSLFYFIRLLIPVKVAYLEPPHTYYTIYKEQIEQIYPGAANEERVNRSLKGSYILEIESAMTNNLSVFRRKRSFYYNALLFALVAVLPYIACLGYHLTKKTESVQRVELVPAKNE